MKAAIHTQYGPPEVVSVQEVDKPVPSRHEVLIRIYATTVNRTDCGFRSAEYFVSRFFSGLFKPKYQILGNEFAGRIEAIGKDVRTYKVGDRVFGYNDSRFGAHAEYMTQLETGTMAIIPEHLSYAEAAPILEGGHYALSDLYPANVGPGKKILVNGGTGAIGSAAVQLARHLGAEVDAVCATPHLELLRSLGANRVFDYTQEDFTQSDGAYDFVFDAVGKSSFGRCKRLLKPKGIYISTELGRNGQNIWLALITPIFGGKKVLFPLPTIDKTMVELLKTLAESGEYKPVVDRTYDLSQIVEAYQYVESRQKIGNVIISMP